MEYLEATGIFIKIINRTVSVSYTHLDVYKRQERLQQKTIFSTPAKRVNAFTSVSCGCNVMGLSLIHIFQKHVALAQRIMDDIIDLELEKIERIMTKIDERCV